MEKMTTARRLCLTVRDGAVYAKDVDSSWRVAPHPRSGKLVLTDPAGRTKAAGYADTDTLFTHTGAMIVQEMAVRGLGVGVL